MTTVLKQLWDGSIRPCERSVQSGSEFARLQQDAQEQHDRFMALLTPEAKDIYSAYCKLDAELSVISDMDFFIKGYRLGAQLIFAAIGEYDSQLPQSV